MDLKKQLPKILAVDDEPEILDIIKNLFPKDEFRLITSSDGLEAIMKFRNEEFDLVISDINMPKMNGVEFMKNARKLRPNVPVFFISAVVEDYASQFGDTSNITFIGKPFKPDDLLSRVRHSLNIISKEGTFKDTTYFREGQVIFTEGTIGKDLYLIKEGQIRMLKKNSQGQPVEVYSIGPGEILGELASMVDDGHFFTAVAQADTIAMRISQTKVDQLMYGQPKWLKILLETHAKKFAEFAQQIADGRTNGKK